jgi:hypothetical protein
MKLRQIIKEALAETKWYDDLIGHLTAIVSPVTSSIFLLTQAIKLFRGPEIKRLRLIFTLRGWEFNAVSILKNFGVVTGIFDSLESAKKYTNTLSKKGVKVDEFVIGSHGGFGELLSPAKEGGKYQFDNSFLYSFKPILKSNSTVFFTACNGANYLEVLKDAADKLGIGVYGAAGLYNYVTNSTDKGFYYCSAKEYNKPTGKRVKPYDILDEDKKIRLNIQKDNKNKNETENSLTYRISIKKGAFDNTKLKNLTLKDINFDNKLKEGKSSEFVSYLDENYGYETFELNPVYIATNYFRKINPNLDFSDLIPVLSKAFDDNKLVLNVLTNNGFVPIQSIKPFFEPKELDNKFFLRSGLCTKVSNSPISWLSVV